MLNVIEFAQKAPRAPGPKRARAPTSLDADISELTSRIMGLQSKARGEICSAILMLDVAAQQAREISKLVRDPATKEDFEGQVSMIEQLVQLARDMALEL